MKEDLPNAEMMAAHAAPIPNTPDPIAESLLAEAGKGGELFAKRRKRAENWVVDEGSVGVSKPSAFADKFMQEQLFQQQQFQQQQQLEQSSVDQVRQQQHQQQQQQLQQEKQFAQQQFREQQQQKQQQSLEIRQQQESMLSGEQMELPPNYVATSLKARSFTPSLDLGIHNVQGINVWANSAPRGWGAQKGSVRAGPPTVSV